jgi:glucokinase
MTPRPPEPPFIALGLDVGGTKIAAAVVSFPSGQVRLRREIPTRLARGGDAVLEAALALARGLAEEARALDLRLQAVGLGLCELVSPDGEIFSANCLPWRSADVVQRLSVIGPAVIEADVRAAALAESLFGAGRGLRQFVYVTIGTGIASCLVLDGRPFTGTRGATGTCASSPLPRLAASTDTGPSPTLEELAAGPALVARFNQLHGDAASSRDVLAAARGGNVVALEVVQSAGQALGATLAWLVNVLDPEALIVGGGLGLSEGPYWDSLVAATRRHIWSPAHRDLPILRAATGTDAGVIGAAAAAWKKLGPAKN